MLARQLLWERVIGVHVRAKEHEEKRREAQLIDQYAHSVRLLKARQEREQE